MKAHDTSTPIETTVVYKWTKPNPRKVKCNFDITLDNQIYGFRYIVRYAQGVFMDAVHGLIAFLGFYNCGGIRFAVSYFSGYYCMSSLWWIINQIHNFKFMEFVLKKNLLRVLRWVFLYIGDCLDLVRVLCWVFLYRGDSVAFVASFSDMKFQFVRRFANQSFHSLARIIGDRIDFEESPHSFVGILNANLN